VCDDPQGFAVNAPNGTVFAESFTSNTPGNSIDINTNGPVSISRVGLTTTINGNLVVVGTITASSVNSGSGSCCTPSDARAKTNVTEVSAADDLATILAMPRRVAFQYTEAYRRADPSTDNHVQQGFIAQELEKVLPRTVRLSNETIDGVTYSDFRRLALDKIVPHVVGAVKQLYAEQQELRDEVNKLRQLVEMMMIKA
jgi:hypothetical protein